MKANPTFDSGSFFRRAIFIAALVGIFLFYTVFSFRGLTHNTGIDQAQVAREVARGNGLTSQFVRPVGAYQMLEKGKEVNLEHMPETFHSPLNILVYSGVLKMIGADEADSYTMDVNDKFFTPDQAIAITCSLFFVLSIGINYLLVSRIFDHKIAAVVALIMMLSDYMWQIALSGLPQMLMLTLFSVACYAAWRGVEAQEAEKNPVVPVLFSGLFFGLLMLTHWMAVWIFIGYFIFAVFYFKPRGIVALALAAVALIFIGAPLAFNYSQTGDALGTAYHAIHKSDAKLRQFGTPELDVRGILSTSAQSILYQFSKIHNYLGGLILAPAFFIALMHQFKRSSIALFRWNILTMWLFAACGMALYGLSEKPVDANQLHMLFAPLMCAYGIAMLSIIWSRTELSKSSGLLGNLHICIIVLVVATPMILFVKNVTNDRSSNRSVQGVHAKNLNLGLKKVTTERDIILSDQPWAVAWYADRHAVWTPRTIAELEKIEELVADTNPIAGIHASSVSYRDSSIDTTWRNNLDLTPIYYHQWVSFFVNDNTPFKKNQQISDLIDPKSGTYKHRVTLTNLLEPSVYYARNLPQAATN